jgi:acyl-coenzyme A thioesterase PaaI-like protein
MPLRLPFSPARISRAIASGERNFIRDAWDRLHALPLGPELFSKVLAIAVPYTGSIRASVVELRRGHARAVLRDRRAVRNHLNSVHAIALANLAELTGNIAVAYALPDDARFIVKALHMDYAKKARGPIEATCDAPTVVTNERKEYEIVVVLRDQAGDEVARGRLKTLVGPKPRSLTAPIAASSGA